MTTPEQNQLVPGRLQALSKEKKILLALRMLQSTNTVHVHQEQKLVGFVVADEGTELDAVAEHLRRKLPHYMLPAQLSVLDSLPRTPNGKLDRAALIWTAIRSKPYERQEVTASVLQDSIESDLADIWRTLLRVSHVSRHDNFFDLGGNSLLAVRMLAQIKAHFEQDIPVSLIVEAPTVGRLAEHVRAAKPQTTSIVTLQADGTGQPVYFLPLHIHGALHYRHLVALLGNERPLYGFSGFAVVDEDGSTPTVEMLARKYVEELLRFQPEGPYYLCGISIAGLIAYEMGRILDDRGTKDVRIVLLDTHGPRYPDSLPLFSALRQLVFPPQRQANSWLSGLKDSGIYWAQRLVSILKTRYSQLRGSFSEDGDNQDPNYNSEVINRHLAAMSQAYLSQTLPYHGSVVLYRAMRQPWNARYDLTLGWQQSVSTAIQVIHVRGDHLGILRRFYVKDVGLHFRTLLGHYDDNHA